MIAKYTYVYLFINADCCWLYKRKNDLPIPVRIISHKSNLWFEYDKNIEETKLKRHGRMKRARDGEKKSTTNRKNTFRGPLTHQKLSIYLGSICYTWWFDEFIIRLFVTPSNTKKVVSDETFKNTVIASWINKTRKNAFSSYSIFSD